MTRMNDTHERSDLEFRHLRLVVQLAETGSATRAAERLHVTQSAVSHQLREIEARLGTPLFIRLGKRMRPTPAGERLLASAPTLLAEVRRVEEDVRRCATDGSGTIRVCAQCQTGYHWLPPLLQAFESRYPHVDVRIAVENTMRPVEALLEGKLDLAIVTQQVDDKRLRGTSTVRRRPRRHRRAVAPARHAPLRHARRARARRRSPSTRHRWTTASPCAKS